MSGSDFETELSALLAASAEGTEGTPASLKARLYSAFVRKQRENGPLASLQASSEAGHPLCIFEKLVQIAPVGERAKSPFFCEVCHARVLAEHFENPPIFWPGCPYVKFNRP